MKSFFVAWIFYAYTKTSHSSIYVLADVLTHIFVHLINLMTVKHPKIGRNSFLSIRFLQVSFLVIHSIETLIWNRCNLPTDNVILIPVNALMIFASIVSMSLGYDKHKV